jgi:3'-5' exoribonuclease 1
MTSLIHKLDSYDKEFGLLKDKIYIVVFDLELTCWSDEDPNRRSHRDMEVTEIGAVVLDAKDLSEKWRFNKTVRPVENPILTEFCTQLTGITQDDVDASDPLPKAMSNLFRDGLLPEPRSFVWACWGSDAKWLQSELKRKCSEYNYESLFKFDPRYINIKLLDGQRRGLKSTCKAFGIEQALPAHRALPDAISTMEVARRLQISVLDAQVSNEKTYKQAIDHRRKLVLKKFVSRHPNVSEDLCEKLLKKVDWDYQTAHSWLTFFRSNKDKF